MTTSISIDAIEHEYQLRLAEALRWYQARRAGELDTYESLFRAWDAGDLSDEATLRRLAALESEASEAMQRWETERTNLRGLMQIIVTRMGGRTAIPGYGRLLIGGGGAVASYDRAALDAIVAELEETQPQLAEALRSCRRTTHRRDSIRIERERPESAADAGAVS